MAQVVVQVVAQVVAQAAKGTHMTRVHCNEKSLTLTFWMYNKGGTFKYIFPRSQKNYFKIINSLNSFSSLKVK